MTTTAIKCAHCGAPLAPPPGALQFTCSYCGIANQIQQRLLRAPRVQVAGQAAPARSSAVGVAVLAVALLVPGLVGGGIALFAHLRSGGGGGPSSLIAAVTEERYLWDDVGGAPAPARAAGSDLVVGRVRTVGGKDELFIQATRLPSLERAWRVGPLESYSSAYRSTHFAVAKQGVVISGPRAELRVAALDTGKELRKVPLSDTVETLCLMDEGAAVFVRQVDKRSLRFDPATGRLTPLEQESMSPCRVSLLGSAPAASGGDALRQRLEEHRRRAMRARRLARGQALPADEPGPPPDPTVDGYKALTVLRGARQGVSVMVKDPGTPIPLVVGFDVSSGAVTWKEPIAASDPMAVTKPGTSDYPGAFHGGYFVVVYGVGQEKRRVTAFDAERGQRLWDTELKDIFAVDHIDRAVLSDAFAFIERTSSLDVVDVRTGKLLGAIGMDTYEK